MDKRSLTSSENGKLGGRPKGSKAWHTLEAEKGKAALIEAYLKNIRPINEALIAKATAGDIQAIRELHDRVYGKPNQPIEGKLDVITKIISIDE